jgi:hypothetical protein
VKSNRFARNVSRLLRYFFIFFWKRRALRGRDLRTRARDWIRFWGRPTERGKSDFFFLETHRNRGQTVQVAYTDGTRKRFFIIFYRFPANTL